MPKILYPKTHIIKGIRARNWSFEEAVYELVDNAPEHGNAKTIQINISRDMIVVTDDGVGIADGADGINRLFTLGDSSAYDVLGRLSQYGIGGKYAAVWLGNLLEVETINNGRYFEKSVNWDVVDRTGNWPDGFEGKGIPIQEYPDALKSFSAGQGTRIAISDLHRRWKVTSSENLLDRVATVFMPGLRDGLIRIRIVHMDSGGIKLDKWAEAPCPSLHDKISISGEVPAADGRMMRWSGIAGLSDNLTRKQNAVLICFRHRVIEATADPFLGANVPTLYAEIYLEKQDQWKFCLSDTKTAIVKHRPALIHSIHKALKEIIEKAQTDAAELALEGMITPIELKLSLALSKSKILGAEPGDVQGQSNKFKDLSTRYGKTGNHPWKKRHGKKPNPSGIKILFADDGFLEGLPYDVQMGESVIIYLNRDKFKDVFTYPPDTRSKAVGLIVVLILSRHIENEVNRGRYSALECLSPHLKEEAVQWAGIGRLAPKLLNVLRAHI